MKAGEGWAASNLVSIRQPIKLAGETWGQAHKVWLHPRYCGKTLVLDVYQLEWTLLTLTQWFSGSLPWDWLVGVRSPAGLYQRLNCLMLGIQCSGLDYITRCNGVSHHSFSLDDGSSAEASFKSFWTITFTRLEIDLILWMTPLLNAFSPAHQLNGSTSIFITFNRWLFSITLNGQWVDDLSNHFCSKKERRNKKTIAMQDQILKKNHH